MEAYSERYDAALALAARTHRNQTRKGSDVPYIVHPVHVSVILMRHGFEEDVLVAGLLHDTVEDQDLPPADIEAQFGPVVAEMVAALTEWKKEAGVPRPWEARKRESLHQLRRASLGAVAVKAADALHTTRSLIAGLGREGPGLWQHLSRGSEQQLWYYDSVAEIVRERLGESSLADELDRAVDELEQTISASEGH